MASGCKKNETRSWPIRLGDLLICSAKKKPTRAEIPEAALYEAAMKVPFGMALCIVEVYDCQKTEKFYVTAPSVCEIQISAQEWELGNYVGGRYAWMTRNLRAFKRPFPVRGFQGLFNVPDDVIERETLLPVKSMTLSEILLEL
jgi:hypothetical protein